MKEIKQILILEYEEETREVLVDVLKRCGNNLVFQTDNKFLNQKWLYSQQSMVKPHWSKHFHSNGVSP